VSLPTFVLGHRMHETPKMPSETIIYTLRRSKWL